MNRNVAVTQQNWDKERKLTAKSSRSVSVSEVASAPTRELRSERPEVVYQLGPKTAKVTADFGESVSINKASSVPEAAAALVPSAPVARSLVTTATPPPQYSALPVQPLRISGVGVPLPLSPDQVDDNESPNVDADDDDDDDDVFELGLDNSEMADERTLMPNLFTGKVDEDADEWTRHLDIMPVAPITKKNRWLYLRSC